MYGDPREILMPTLLNNTKLAERGRFMKRLFIAMLAATIIAFAISYFLQVATFYMYGTTVDLWTVQFYPVYAMDRLASAIQTPKAAFQFDSLGPAKGIFHVLVGGGAFLIVSFLRSRLHWWPIHPVGILTAHSMPAHRLWFLFFVGWACKGLAQKYAKGPSFAIIKRFFLGLIIGEVLIQMVSTLLPIIFLK